MRLPSGFDKDLCHEHSKVKPCEHCRVEDEAWEEAFGPKPTPPEVPKEAVPAPKKRYSPKTHNLLNEATYHFQRDFVMKKLKEFKWHIKETAAHIGMSRAHFYRVTQALDIEIKKYTHVKGKSRGKEKPKYEESKNIKSPLSKAER